MRSRVLMGSCMLLGCVLHSHPEDDHDPCLDVSCSTHATCGGGDCFCDQGYEGDAYAADGCQPSRPPAGGDCDGGCGANAYCGSDDQCWCEAGYAGVCVTADCLPEAAVCDGATDCPDGGDEDPGLCSPAVIQQWLVTDDCEDGSDPEFRLWAWEREWVWPSINEVFITGGLGVDTYQTIECAAGELVCFGASAGERSWGVGVEGLAECDDCCATCAADLLDVGYLGC